MLRLVLLEKMKDSVKEYLRGRLNGKCVGDEKRNTVGVFEGEFGVLRVGSFRLGAAEGDGANIGRRRKGGNIGK